MGASQRNAESRGWRGPGTMSWGVLGLLVSFGIAALPSIGLFVLAGALILGVTMAQRRVPWRSAPAFLIGAALTPLYIAARNIGGPGWVCATTASSQTCSQMLNPWPFAILGALLLLTGASLLHRRRAPLRRS